MADLVARPAWAGLDLPFLVGGVTFAALPDAPMLSVAPFRGNAAAVGERLGAPLPDPGRAVALGNGAELIWAGLDLWFLLRAEAQGDVTARLDGLAAVTDQSDGWVALALTGAGASDVLARLVPIDLAPGAFPAGSAARTELRHMMCVLLARPGGFELMVMRSFTGSAVHEIAQAMLVVAARASLG